MEVTYRTIDNINLWLWFEMDAPPEKDEIEGIRRIDPVVSHSLTLSLSLCVCEREKLQPLMRILHHRLCVCVRSITQLMRAGLEEVVRSWFILGKLGSYDSFHLYAHNRGTSWHRGDVL